MNSFSESLHIVGFKNAAFFASDLFRECFALPFPVPQDLSALPIPTPSHHWHQYVAFYKWSETSLEPVGFCNWIRYGDVYLEGGMCVRKNFYRRLPREHWNECRALGGVAQLMMETAERELNDCIAWFGYCGDKKAYLVDSRVGYRRTDRPFLIVKWFQEVPAARQREVEDLIAAIGPF
jgi:hypothetical protein